MPLLNVVNWWATAHAFMTEQNKGTPDGWAKRRSIASAESKLRAVLYRALYALNQMAANVCQFSTFLLYVDTTTGRVDVGNVDQHGSLGSPYLAPEVFAMFLRNESFGAVPYQFSCKNRSWVFGLILCELLGAPPPWDLTEKRGEEREVMLKVLRAAIENRDASVADALFADDLKRAISPGLADLARECLWVDPIRRASVSELLHHPYFRKMRSNQLFGAWRKVPVLDFTDEEPASPRVKTAGVANDCSEDGTPMPSDVELHSTPNVLKLPTSLDECTKMAGSALPFDGFDVLTKEPTQHEAVMDKFRKFLDKSTEFIATGQIEKWEAKILPELALHFIKYPIPESFRHQAWMSILQINEKHALWAYTGKQRRANRLRLTKGSSKRVRSLLRQLKKDLPRCHRYHQFMRLPRIQKMMENVLLAWSLEYSDRVYWQGLDSVCAAFAVACKSEPTAYTCMDVFISRLLPGVFIDDNSETLQERLLRLQQLLSFLDPELSCHLSTVGVTPNLYAIPWLMTLFAHILPLDLLFGVWDVLLGLHRHEHCTVEKRGAEMLSVLFAACLLSEFRGRLLSCTFEQAVAFLTRLPMPLTAPVHRALERLPTAFLLVPRSVLRGTTNTSLLEARSADADPISLKRPLNQIRVERSPRVSPIELLKDPMIEHSLLVDVRAASRFREIHILGSRNFSIAGHNHARQRACKEVQKARLELKRLYVAVVGEVVVDAAEMAGALVNAGIPMVLIVDGGFNDVVEHCLAGELLVQSKK
jgi:hypothetical protein